MHQGKGGTMTTPAGPGDGAPDPGPGAIISERRQLMNLAYRLLGSPAEAEDAVQEAYARNWLTDISPPDMAPHVVNCSPNCDLRSSRMRRSSRVRSSERTPRRPECGWPGRDCRVPS